jgi:hypothetical protein
VEPPLRSSERSRGSDHRVTVASALFRPSVGDILTNARPAPSASAARSPRCHASRLSFGVASMDEALNGRCSIPTLAAQVAAYPDVWAGSIQSLPTGMVTKPSVQLSSSTVQMSVNLSGSSADLGRIWPGRRLAERPPLKLYHRHCTIVRPAVASLIPPPILTAALPQLPADQCFPPGDGRRGRRAANRARLVVSGRRTSSPTTVHSASGRSR